VRQLARVEIANRGEAAVATVTGEVDMSNAEAIGGRLAGSVPNTARALVLDLRGVTYLDSAGVRIVFSLDERLSRRGQRLVLVVAEGANVERVLDLTGVAAVMPVERTVEAALARVGGGPA
jgi:anti-anti-sigma factor